MSDFSLLGGEMVTTRVGEMSCIKCTIHAKASN